MRVQAVCLTLFEARAIVSITPLFWQRKARHNQCVIKIAERVTIHRIKSQLSQSPGTSSLLFHLSTRLSRSPGHPPSLPPQISSSSALNNAREDCCSPFAARQKTNGKTC